jgi:hypothetical protein
VSAELMPTESNIFHRLAALGPELQINHMQL